MSFLPSSRSKLTMQSAWRFPGDTLFDKVARVVCRAECLPRKELYESWEVARRTRRRFRGGRVVDLACGHALVSHLLLLLDERSERAIAVDTRIPESAAKLSALLCEAWPRLAGRVELVEAPLEGVPLQPDDLVVSAHACGTLTDRILARAIEASARVVVLPCCHDHAACDAGGLGGWIDPALAIDVTRAARLRAHGYAVRTQTIPESITPKNRLLFGDPRSASGRPEGGAGGLGVDDA
jgi:SAM-dependent methyltransferase